MLPCPAPLRKMCVGGLLLALAGCSRSAVVVAPENASRADEPAAARQVVPRQDGETEDVRFAFPEDAGGDLLAKVLPPKETEAPPLERAEPPRRSAASARWTSPALPLPTTPTAMPRLPRPVKTTPLLPRLVIEETLGGLLETPLFPQPPSLPDTGRVRVPSANVNEPIPLPIQAQPVSDRASLDDPTAEASTAAAVAAPIPARTTKAPFLKLTLPDPYDHRRMDSVTTLAEQAEPALGTPRTPTK